MRFPDGKVVQVFKQMAEVQMELQPGEHVLIVADPAQDPRILEAIHWAVSQTGAVPTVALQPNTGWDASDVYALTKPIQKAYLGADVVISATRSSLAATYGRPQEFRDAMEQGKKHRLFWITDRRMDEILADANTDYFEIKRLNAALEEILVHATTMRIVTEAGTDFVGDLRGVSEYHIRRGCSQNGFAVRPGQYSGRPEGEVHMPPRPESMEGILIVDGPIANIADRPDEPVRIEVKKGRVVRIHGGETADKLDRFLSSFDVDQHYTSELAIGTNRAMRGSGRSPNCAKRGLGNFHVAYGGWWGMQDAIPYRVHGDMVMLWAPGSQYIIDGKPLFENGEFTFKY